MRILLVLILCFNLLYSNNLIQKQKDNILKINKIINDLNISQKYKKVIIGIYGVESSFGLHKSGDKYYYKNNKRYLKEVCKYSLGYFQIKTSTAIEVIKKYPNVFNTSLINKAKCNHSYEKLQNYKKIKTKLIKQMYLNFNNKEKLLVLKEMLKVINKKIIRLKNNTLLINKLLNDLNFQVKIVYYYLKLLENRYKNINFWQIIGLYNGGIKNKRYYRKVILKYKIAMKYK